MARIALAAASIALLSLSALTAAHAQVGATIVIQSGSPHYQRPAPALVVGAARLDDDSGANLCMRRRQGAQRQQGDGSGGEGYACHGVLLRKDSVRNRES